MEPKQVQLVDAFADEPMGGVSIPVVLETVTDSQLRSIAGEFGTPAAVTLRDDGLHVVERGTDSVFVAAGIAGAVSGDERGELDPETHTLTVSSDTTEREYAVEIEDDRAVQIELPCPDIETSPISEDRVAPALGVDVAALQDVGADLPIGQTDACGGTLFVPVNFLEHLGNAVPDTETLAAILDTTETTRLCAFTFDTLERETDIHTRIFTPNVPDCERAASGVAVAACGRYLSQYNAFDGDRSMLRVESGRFLGRPGTLTTTLAARPTVGGRALTVLDGSLSVPDEETDDIIEV